MNKNWTMMKSLLTTMTRTIRSKIVKIVNWEKKRSKQQMRWKAIYNGYRVKGYTPRENMSTPQRYMNAFARVLWTSMHC